MKSKKSRPFARKVELTSHRVGRALTEETRASEPGSESTARPFLDTISPPVLGTILDLSDGNSARIGAHGPNGSPYSKNFFKCEIVHTPPADT
jgi:hypothetical protein